MASGVVTKTVAGGVNACFRFATLSERGWLKCMLSRWTCPLDVTPYRVDEIGCYYMNNGE
jgi:hypothetical protein